MINIYRDKMAQIYKKWGYGSDVLTKNMAEFSYFLKKNIESTPLSLYRYSNADFYCLRSIETDKVYLSDIGKMNDIFEGIQIANDDVPSCNELNSISDIVKIKSFSEEKNSLIMWGHYTNNAKGICIKYDLNLLEKNNRVFDMLFPVLYYDKRISGGFSYKDLTDCLMKYKKDGNETELESICEMTPIYLIKSRDWEMEKEWRIIQNIYDSKVEKKEEYVILPCISEIYLGFRMQEEMKECILDIVKRKNNERKNKIKVYSTKIHDSEYKVEIDKLLIS